MKLLAEEDISDRTPVLDVLIEKSKGFSDSKSTTATRRLRNRQMPFFGINNVIISIENIIFY